MPKFVFCVKLCIEERLYMDIKNLLNNAFEVKEIKPGSLQIKTGAVLPNGKNLYCFIDKTQNGYIISDKKYVLKYMNDLYLLNSNDVKNCITSVIQINKFKLVQGVLFSEIKAESEVVQKIFQYVMCVAQLINMYAFFDPPA